MNRRKKGNQILKARAKKAKAKLAPGKTRRYISKAERARMEAEGSPESGTTAHTDNIPPEKTDPGQAKQIFNPGKDLVQNSSYTAFPER